MLPVADFCDGGCGPASHSNYLHLRRQSADSSLFEITLSSIPFIVSFAIASVLAYRRLYPVLSLDSEAQRAAASFSKDALPLVSPFIQAGKGFQPKKKRKPVPISGVVFAVTMACTTVLAELILCEISDILDPAARSYAMRLTTSTVLILLVLVTPFLEIRSILAGAETEYGMNPTPQWRTKRLLMMMCFAAWLAFFWWIGNTLPGSHFGGGYLSTPQSLTEASLERIGVIGVCLLASLSGFASISALWQTFASGAGKKITEADIARKQLGLDSAEEMLASKRSKMRALERKLSDTTTTDIKPNGIFAKVVGSIRGNADVQERRALQLEISGLETMRLTLSTSISILKHRRESQLGSRTAWGRFTALMSTLFALYCLYRVPTTTLHFVRRWWDTSTSDGDPSSHITSFYSISHSASSASAIPPPAPADPVSSMLSILANYWDPTLNRAAWSTTISFLLSGVIILLSFRQILSTSHFLLRFSPSASANPKASSYALLTALNANRALILSQLAATYVISSVLLLRSSLPDEIGGVITEALGAPIQREWIESWFQLWFLGGCTVTVLCLVLVRVVAGRWEDEELTEGGDDDGEKRS
jgi:hypothetical protein